MTLASTRQQSLAPAPHTAAGLNASWTALAGPGGWFSGAHRVAIAHEARAARACSLCAERKSALSVRSGTGPHSRTDEARELSASVVDSVHRIATDPGRLSKTWYADARSSGLEPEEIVEMTSIVSLVAIADTLARGLGLPKRPFPSPQPGKPAREPVSGAKVGRGWVPMVDPSEAQGLTKAMYEEVESAAGFVFNVARALTSVPEALRDFFTAFFPNYTTHGPVRQGGLSRSQVELLAASTSAHNDCFY